MRSFRLRVLLYLKDKLEAAIRQEFKIEAKNRYLLEANKSFAKSLELQAPKKVSCTYTDDEIDKMSSEEYYWKVLNPRGIKKEVAVTSIGGVCQ